MLGATLSLELSIKSRKCIKTKQKQSRVPQTPANRDIIRDFMRFTKINNEECTAFQFMLYLIEKNIL